MLQNQLSFHFGRENVIEHCVCLTILTEYICSAYNNKELYKTFEVPVSEKYVEKIFNQLYTEWMKLFRTELPRGIKFRVYFYIWQLLLINFFAFQKSMYIYNQQT